MKITSDLGASRWVPQGVPDPVLTSDRDYAHKTLQESRPLVAMAQGGPWPSPPNRGPPKSTKKRGFELIWGVAARGPQGPPGAQDPKPGLLTYCTLDTKVVSTCTQVGDPWGPIHDPS